MTAEDCHILNETHEIVQSLLKEAHIAVSSELDDVTRAKAQDSKDINSMISVLLVHWAHRKANPPSNPAGMSGMQRHIVGSESDSIEEKIRTLKRLKAKLEK